MSLHDPVRGESAPCHMVRVLTDFHVWVSMPPGTPSTTYIRITIEELIIYANVVHKFTCIISQIVYGKLDVASYSVFSRTCSTINQKEVEHKSELKWDRAWATATIENMWTSCVKEYAESDRQTDAPVLLSEHGCLPYQYRKLDSLELRIRLALESIYNRSHKQLTTAGAVYVTKSMD